MAKTLAPAQVASPLLATIAQAGDACLATAHGGAFSVAPAGESVHTAEFDDSVFVVVEYTLYNEVKHSDKNSARLFLCNDLKANEFGEFEGGDDEFDDESDSEEAFGEFESDGEYSDEYDEYDE
jgi:hypothetical protein